MLAESKILKYLAANIFNYFFDIFSSFSNYYMKTLLILSSALTASSVARSIESVIALNNHIKSCGDHEYLFIKYCVICADLRNCPPPLNLENLSILHILQSGIGLYAALNTGLKMFKADFLYVLQDDLLSPAEFFEALSSVVKLSNLFTHFWFPVYDESISNFIYPAHPSEAVLGPLGKHQGLLLNLNLLLKLECDVLFCEKFKILGDINQHFRLLPNSIHYSSCSRIPIAHCTKGGVSSKPSILRFFEAISARVVGCNIYNSIFSIIIKVYYFLNPVKRFHKILFN